MFSSRLSTMSARKNKCKVCFPSLNTENYQRNDNDKLDEQSNGISSHLLDTESAFPPDKPIQPIQVKFGIPF